MNRAERRKMVKSMNTPAKIQEYSNDLERVFKREYEEKYKRRSQHLSECMLIALKYTLHFSENTNFGNKRIHDFMSDFIVTFENLTNGEYSKQEYIEILKKEKINI